MGNALATPPTGARNLPMSPKGAESTRRNFTVKELAEFDGTTRNKPIYIALRGEVYDVSASREVYGPKGEFQALAGRDASRALARSSLATEDVASLDLSDLDAAHFEALEARVQEFRDDKGYPNVGRLVIPRDLTLQELRRFNGTDDPRGTVLVAINGTIYDVTLNGLMHYGPEGTYCQFAGRDASRALACMSLDPDYLDDPDTSAITDEQRSSMTDWAARFQQKYAAVGHLQA